MDDSFKQKKIKVKESTTPNHFYSDTFTKNNNNNKTINNNEDEIEYNNINFIETNSKGDKNRINLKKNNLPMVNKK